MTAAGVVLMIAGALDLHPGTDPISAERISGWASALSAGAEDGPVIAKLEPGSPRFLRIPALGIRSRVVPIRAPHRTLVPPSDPQLLGWWADGAKPGAAKGTAVITGHTVHAGGGALDDLESVHPGDQIVVRTGQESLPYAVRRVRTYDKHSFDELAPEVFSQKGRGRLVLVTCEDWNGERYLSNVVVTAAPRLVI